MLNKVVGRVSPDVLVPDLEDSVPTQEKANARKALAAALPTLCRSFPAVMPRVNSIESGLLLDDLHALFPAASLPSYSSSSSSSATKPLFGISIGKVSSGSQAKEVCWVLEQMERRAGMKVGSVKVVPWIETAQAVVNAFAISSASPRIVAVAFGADDYCNDMEIPKNAESIGHVRHQIAVAAKAANVVALDTPFPDFKNEEGLKAYIAHAKSIGFRGMFAIHPTQVQPINEGFAPSSTEIEYAQRVVQVYERALKEGKGSASLDGKTMVDAPVAKKAYKLLGLPFPG